MRFAHPLPIARVVTTRTRRVGEVSTSSALATSLRPNKVGSNDRIAIMKKLFIGAALAALVGTPVLAADMTVKAPAPQTYSWEGLYIGGNFGWLGIEGVSLSGTPADSDTLAFLGPCSAAGACPMGFGSANANSVTGGGQFGFNWQIRNWVVGLEADVQASSANATSSVNVNVPAFAPYFATQSIKETEFGTIRGRAGMLVTPTLLAYVTGGFAWARRTRASPSASRRSLQTAAWASRVHRHRWDRRCRPRMGAGKQMERGRRISLCAAGGHQPRLPDRSARGGLHARRHAVVSAQCFPIGLQQQCRAAENKL